MADKGFHSEWIESGAGKVHLSLWGKRSAGPAILFLPGTGCAAEFYEPFLGPLANEGFRVIGIDYRGHGRSDGPRGRFTIPDILEDIGNALTFCIERFGKRVGVMGSSMGGILTIFAAAHDARFACALAHNAAIPSDMATKFPGGRIGLQAAGVIGRLAPHVRVHTRVYVKWGKVMENQEALRKLMSDPLFVSRYELSAIASLMTYRPDLDNIRCPVMALTGAEDVVVPPWASHMTYEKLKVEKEYVEIPGAKHMLLLEYIGQTLPVAVRWFQGRLA